MAFQHSCSSQYGIACPRNRPGKPTARTCPVCGSAWTVREGRYGVFTWRGDGNYRTADAAGYWQSQAAAERHLTGGHQVVRFIVGA